MNTMTRLTLTLALTLAALPARADPPPPDETEARSAALDARMGALLSPTSGLTAAEVASRAAATSFDVQARHAELEAASAAVDQAIVGYFPRLMLTARYMRVDPLPDQVLGNLLAVSQTAPLGPIKPSDEDVRAPLPPLATPRDVRKLYAEALDRRPEIRALDETAWSLREQGRVARAAAYPRLDALGQVSYDNPDPRIFPPTQAFQAGWAVGAQITWTLNDIGVGVTQGRQVDARRAQVEAQKGQLLDGLRNEVAQSEQAVEDAEVAIETGARGLAAAEESYRVRRSLFQNGKAISVELSDAETELTRASLDLVNARVELRVARARLLHAVGRDALDPRPAAAR